MISKEHTKLEIKMNFIPLLIMDDNFGKLVMQIPTTNTLTVTPDSDK